jgi:hypothetical protein
MPIFKIKDNLILILVSILIVVLELMEEFYKFNYEITSKHPAQGPWQ